MQSLLKAGATPGPDWQPVPYNAVQAFGNTVVMYLGFHVILGTCLLWISNYIYTKFRLSKSRTLFSGTYEEARQRLRRAEDTSDLQSEVDLGRGKRKKKTKRVYSSEDEDDMQSPSPPRSIFRSILYILSALATSC